MWLSAKEYAELKAKADRADVAESRVKGLEEKREAERERHYKHVFEVTNQVLVAAGRFGVKDVVVVPPDVPASEQKAIPPEGEEIFIEDYVEAGMDRGDAVEAFAEYQKTGILPYERETETEN